MRDYSKYHFDFEKLEVYQKAITFTNEVFTVTKGFKREVQYSLGDQLRRAALSICNNLAEGSRKHGKSRVQFFQYALDSARECIPMGTLSLLQQEMTTEQADAFRAQAVHICNMLYRLIRSTGGSAMTHNA